MHQFSFIAIGDSTINFDSLPIHYSEPSNDPASHTISIFEILIFVNFFSSKDEIICFGLKAYD